jgi:thioredoxin-like negative regulator of GroEL
MDAAMLDQYLQVVFDLQSVEQHEQALELFGLIKYEWLDAKYQRELYFWKAESNYALHRYAQSAWLYLMSARAVDPEMMDLWSQSARYKAADALTKAKLFDDAYTMYSELLAMTPSETRRSWIRQAMQQVELLRNAENNQHEVKS